MTKIAIKDLEMNQELDKQAMASVRGGDKMQPVLRGGKVVILTGVDPRRRGDIYLPESAIIDAMFGRQFP